MKKLFRDAATSFAAKLGYCIIPRWRLENLALSQHLKKLFERFAINTVFDVGANEGQYRRFLRREVMFTGTIQSFEPIPELAEEMCRQAKADSSWHVHNYALGNEDSTATLNVMTRNTFSSFRNPDHSTLDEYVNSNTIVKPSWCQCAGSTMFGQR